MMPNHMIITSSSLHDTAFPLSSQALDIFHVIHDLLSLEETQCVCQMLRTLAHFKQKWHFSLPTLHDACLHGCVSLTTSCIALLGHRAALKHVVKTMHSSGTLLMEGGVAGGRGWRRGQEVNQLEDGWVTGSPVFAKLQDG